MSLMHPFRDSLACSFEKKLLGSKGSLGNVLESPELPKDLPRLFATLLRKYANSYENMHILDGSSKCVLGRILCHVGFSFNLWYGFD
ncbi:hypothetical protein CEXT_195801 [Caerostris extrusa]|uniref:Uncharacterized protein n=1 Tax=Caerostris extrusa TaxID=172846 RepID=A0AAV4P0E7_CAEEX|nr:hypothetical protein CEXT_195801 [Caerostris extrusa]